jgi:hypothetical protein
MRAVDVCKKHVRSHGEERRWATHGVKYCTAVDTNELLDLLICDL